MPIVFFLRERAAFAACAFYALYILFNSIQFNSIHFYSIQRDEKNETLRMITKENEKNEKYRKLRNITKYYEKKRKNVVKKITLA